MMSVNELSEVVEPSGLFTDAQLVAAYKQLARNHTIPRQKLRIAIGAKYQKRDL
jgi:hypothetical protein